MIPEPKLCINCKWIATNASKDVSRYRCMAPQNKNGVNLVDGSTEWSLDSCREARAEDIYQRYSLNYCGPEAKWFELKPPDTVFIYSENSALKPLERPKLKSIDDLLEELK